MKRNSKEFIFSCVLLFASAVLNVYLAFLLQKVIDSASSKSVEALIQSLLITLGFMFIDLALSLFAKCFSTKYVQSTLENMKDNRFNFVFSKCNKSRNEEEQSELSSFTADIDLVEQNYVREKLNMFFYSSQFIIALVALISISWVLTLSVAVVSLLPVLVPGIFQKKIQKLQDDYSKNVSQYTLFTDECLNAKQEIISYNQIGSFQKRHNEIDHTLEKSRRKTRFMNSAVTIICSNLGFLAFLTALGVGSYFVIKGSMSFGYMIASVQLINSIMNPLNLMTDSLTRYKSSKNVAKKFEKTTDKVEQKGEIISEFKNAIEISNLSFSYNSDNAVLKDISFVLPKNKKIALIGPSGCGKSTIAKILAREISDFQGDIKLDGVPIQNIDIKKYNELIRFVRQDSFVFTDTIRQNIVFSDKDYDYSDLKSVLQISKVDNFVTNSEDLNKLISNSWGISGGQKQRIVIARALLRNSPILILDEFTSALDLEIAQDIIQEILQIKDITCLVITHQCDDKTLSMFDSVINLNDINSI